MFLRPILFVIMVFSSLVAHTRSTSEMCDELFSQATAHKSDSVARVFSDYASNWRWSTFKPATYQRLQRRSRNIGWHKGFVQLSNGREVYTEYRPAQEGKPTLVFLNGLTHSLKDWDTTVAELKDTGWGIVLYDATGQGLTLEEYQIYPLGSIPLDDQREDLQLLLGTLQIKEKVNLVGLSYGGGHAIYFANKHPELVANIIAVAPFTEKLPEQDHVIRFASNAARMMFPWVQTFLPQKIIPIYNEVLYDFFLAGFVYGTYPSAEPAIMEFWQKPTGAFQMIREMRHFVASQHVDNLPAHSLHLVIPELDQYIPAELPNRFWDAVPEAARGSRLDLALTRHVVNLTQPLFTARWVEAILNQQVHAQLGLRYKGDPLRMTAQSTNGNIAL